MTMITSFILIDVEVQSMLNWKSIFRGIHDSQDPRTITRIVDSRRSGHIIMSWYTIFIDDNERI